MVESMKDIVGDLSWLEEEPDEPKPEPLRCKGYNLRGERCPKKLNPFPMFGRWNRPEMCERCRDGKMTARSKSSEMQKALNNANLPADYKPRTNISDELNYFLGTCGQEFMYVYDSRGETRKVIQAVVYKYISDRTSTLSKASAWYETEYIMMDRLRPDGGKNIQDYVRPKFLAIGDFGKLQPSEFVNRSLFSILEERRRLRRKTIIGSPWSLTQLAGYPWGDEPPKNAKKYDSAIVRTIYEWAGGDEARAANVLNILKLG